MSCYLSKYSFFFLIAISIIFFSDLGGQENSLPAFEKIYVTPYQILSTPEGTYYIAPNGTREKVRAVRSDWHGTYIIKFKHECPICGRCYEGDTIEEGYDCPLMQTEVIPHLWSK